MRQKIQRHLHTTARLEGQKIQNYAQLPTPMNNQE
jgi:hypothetical protein